MNSNKPRNYLCEYSYQGSRWSIEIAASSLEDAEARLRQLAGGKVLGVTQAVIPVEFGWVARLSVFLRNASRLFQVNF